MVTIAAVALVMTGCTKPEDPPPPPTSTAAPTDGSGTQVVDASAELEKLPDVERFLEQAIAQVRQKYPGQVPEGFTAASVMGELEAIDKHVGDDGVLDYAAAKDDPAITRDSLDPYARTYRTLGGDLTGTDAAAKASEAGSPDAAAAELGGGDTSLETSHASTVLHRVTHEEQDGSQEDETNGGYQGPREMVPGPDGVEDYKAIGDAILQGRVLTFSSDYNLGRARFDQKLSKYVLEHLGDDQVFIEAGKWGDDYLSHSLVACIVNLDAYEAHVPGSEQNREKITKLERELCLTQTVSGSTGPEPLLPLSSPMPESAALVEADVQTLIIQELWPIVKDLIGLTDLEKCFTEGDILACMMTLINFLPVGKAIKAIKAIPAVTRAIEKIVTFIASKGKKLPVAAPRGCFTSFAGTTPVLMADGTHKPIREIRPGDHVRATDPITGKAGSQLVIDTFVHQDSLIDLTLADGTVITTTADHPFWSATDQTFEDASDLSEGEQLLSVNGTQQAVEALDTRTTHEGRAYNLAVLGPHTYHVGNADILVHNMGCGVSPIDSVLKNWQPRTFRYGNVTISLQRAGMQHILERHHPKFFNPNKAKERNDMFRKSRTVDEIVGLIDETIRQKVDEIEAIASRPRPEQRIGNVRATIDGAPYELGISKGKIGKFHPVGMSEP